ncbi:MAG: hypothetical protein K2J67_12450, partial [Lachnospiraceae bacterium]|nr:hypothetical protein [Lachnospiraceae bacterium]
VYTMLIITMAIMFIVMIASILELRIPFVKGFYAEIIIIIPLIWIFITTIEYIIRKLIDQEEPEYRKYLLRNLELEPDIRWKVDVKK